MSLTRDLARPLIRPLTAAVTEGVGGGIAIPMTPAIDTPVFSYDTVSPTFPTVTEHAFLRIGGANTGGADTVNDTKFRYPGTPTGVIVPWPTTNYYLSTSLIPGGASQSRYWDTQIEFVTTSKYVTLLAHTAGAGANILVMVNGAWVNTPYVISPLANNVTGFFSLQFPDNRSRKIKMVMQGGSLQMHSVFTEAAYPPVRSAAAGKTLLCIGDSITAGANGVAPGGATALDTWPQWVGTALGYDHVCNAAIGGTKWVALGSGTADQLTSHFGGGRLSTALGGMTPDAIMFMGSRNDASAVQADLDAITAAVTSALGQVSSFAKVYVAGTITALTANNDAVRAGTLAASRPFIDLSGLIYGTGKSTAPTGDGNADTYIGSDGVHPTFAGHQYIRTNYALRLRGIGANA